MNKSREINELVNIKRVNLGVNGVDKYDEFIRECTELGRRVGEVRYIGRGGIISKSDVMGLKDDLGRIQEYYTEYFNKIGGDNYNKMLEILSDIGREIRGVGVEEILDDIRLDEVINFDLGINYRYIPLNRDEVINEDGASGRYVVIRDISGVEIEIDIDRDDELKRRYGIRIEDDDEVRDAGNIERRIRVYIGGAKDNILNISYMEEFRGVSLRELIINGEDVSRLEKINGENVSRVRSYEDIIHLYLGGVSVSDYRVYSVMNRGDGDVYSSRYVRRFISNYNNISGREVRGEIYGDIVGIEIDYNRSINVGEIGFNYEVNGFIGEIEIDLRYDGSRQVFLDKFSRIRLT